MGHQFAHAEAADRGLVPRTCPPPLARNVRKQVVVCVQEPIHVVSLQETPGDECGTTALRATTQVKFTAPVTHPAHPSATNVQCRANDCFRNCTRTTT